MNQRVS